MNMKRSFSKSISLIANAIALLTLTASSAFAQSSAMSAANAGDRQNSLFYRYPPDSIRSEETADRLLAELASERAIVNSRYEEEQSKCAPKFFINNCMEVAVDQRREAILKLRRLENEANLFKRRQRVIERDLALEESRKKDAAKALSVVPANSEDSPKSPEKKPLVQPVSNTLKSSEDTGKGPTKRQIEHNQREESRKQDDAAKASSRAEKIASYERKVKASEDRQLEIARRKAEKEIKQKEKLNVSAPATSLIK